VTEAPMRIKEIRSLDTLEDLFDISLGDELLAIRCGTLSSSSLSIYGYVRTLKWNNGLTVSLTRYVYFDSPLLFFPDCPEQACSTLLWLRGDVSNFPVRLCDGSYIIRSHTLIEDSASSLYLIR
jgi:hypothetical protein